MCEFVYFKGVTLRIFATSETEFGYNAAHPSRLAQATKLMCTRAFRNEFKDAPPSISAISSYPFSEAARLVMRKLHHSSHVPIQNPSSSIGTKAPYSSFDRLSASSCPTQAEHHHSQNQPLSFKFCRDLPLIFISRSTKRNRAQCY